MNNLEQNNLDQNTNPQQPTTDPTQPVVPQGLNSTSPNNNSSKNKVLLGVLIALVVLVGAGVAYLLLKPQTTTTPSQQSNGAAEMTTTSLTNQISGSPTVAVTHPSDWQVMEDSSNEDGAIMASKTITSAKGNSLELSYSDLGVGGSCESDSQKFTLTKKLSTDTPDVYFTEYTLAPTASEPASTRGLRIDTSTFDVANKEVGAEGTNVCDTKISYYSRVGGNGTEDSVTVTVKGHLADDPQNTLFADIADDTDFIAMLQSLKVTD